MKFGVADYGILVWDGAFYDKEDELRKLKEIGYEGLEQMSANSASEALQQATMFKRLGMDFTTCKGPDVQSTIQWTAALGKEYVWLNVGIAKRDVDFEDYCRKTNIMTQTCARWGIRAAIHNHLGQRIENQQELEDFLKACPDVGIVFDTGHLSAAGGDPIEIIKKYHDRICVMHLKDVHIKDESIGLDKWQQRLRFCEIGGGNTSLDNLAVVKALKDVGYDGWVHIEHDTHLQDPYIDLATSLKRVKKAAQVLF